MKHKTKKQHKTKQNKTTKQNKQQNQQKNKTKTYLKRPYTSQITKKKEKETISTKPIEKVFSLCVFTVLFCLADQCLETLNNVRRCNILVKILLVS
jgi:hypothetical protein